MPLTPTLKTLILAVAMAVTGLAAHATTIRIVETDGNRQILLSDYVNGFGTAASGEFVAAGLGAYDSYGDDVTIRVTMGDFTDYFRPVTGATLLDMLTSSTQHTWSATLDGTYVAPVYLSDSQGLFGGSDANWPMIFVPGDTRQFLSFWGGNVPGGGGCCSSSVGNTASGQAFTMDLILPSEIPLPAGAWLLIGGLGGLTLLRRRNRRAA